MKSHKAQSVAQRTEADDLAVAQKETLAAFGQKVSALGERILKLQQEGIRFMGERFEDNMKTLQCLSSCKSFPDLLAAQQKWFAETAQAYGEEWSRFSELMTKPTNGGGHDEDASRH
jgi:hypothetical protein